MPGPRFPFGCGSACGWGAAGPGWRGAYGHRPLGCNADPRIENSLVRSEPGGLNWSHRVSDHHHAAGRSLRVRAHGPGQPGRPAVRVGHRSRRAGTGACAAAPAAADGAFASDLPSRGGWPEQSADVRRVPAAQGAGAAALGRAHHPALGALRRARHPLHPAARRRLVRRDAQAAARGGAGARGARGLEPEGGGVVAHGRALRPQTASFAPRVQMATRAQSMHTLACNPQQTKLSTS